MNLREKLLSYGIYPNKQIDKIVNDEYKRRVNLLKKTKTFEENKNISITEENMDESEKFRRKLLADYFNIPEEDLIKMSEEELNNLIIENEQNKRKNKIKIRKILK